jgi:hypothetical protein
MNLPPKASRRQIAAMNHDPDIAFRLEFGTIVFPARGGMDRDQKRIERRQKDLRRDKSVTLQTGIARFERGNRHGAGHFLLAVETGEPDALAVEQFVFVQESKLTHAILIAANCGRSDATISPSAASRHS